MRPRREIITRMLTVGGGVALVALGILCVANVRSTSLRRIEWSRRMAMLQTCVSVDSSVLYHVKFGRLPANARELGEALLLEGASQETNEGWIDASNQSLVDPWGTPFSIQTGRKTFSVISAGPDGKLGTRDDIAFTKDLPP